MSTKTLSTIIAISSISFKSNMTHCINRSFTAAFVLKVMRLHPPGPVTTKSFTKVHLTLSDSFLDVCN